MSQNSLQNDLIVLYEKTREKVRGFQKKTYQSDMGILKEENQTLLECVKENSSLKCIISQYKFITIISLIKNFIRLYVSKLKGK